jgi:hypothetical protein
LTKEGCNGVQNFSPADGVAAATFLPERYLESANYIKLTSVFPPKRLGLLQITNT